jgi:hypothetical protein
MSRILRKQFNKETGMNWTKSQGEIDIDYVVWLENKIGQKPQSQHSLQEQLKRLIPEANRLGLYDAADFLMNNVKDKNTKILNLESEVQRITRDYIKRKVPVTISFFNELESNLWTVSVDENPEFWIDSFATKIGAIRFCEQYELPYKVSKKK